MKEKGENTLQIYLCMIVASEFCSILKHVIITTVNIDLIYQMKRKTRHLCFDDYSTKFFTNIS